ncbi:MAG: hypothetical protein L6Q33_04155 [Bacteriovoracaceae bacterium]|nr:hypothetical protein [Bacteriovoracaceae bacterium]
MKKNTLISYVLFSLFSFGCSERVTNIYQNNETKEVLTIEEDSLKQKDITFEEWKRLVLTEEKSNHALAKIFLPYLKNNHKTEIQEFIETHLTDEEATKVLEKVIQSFKDKELSLLIQDAPWKNTALFEKSIYAQIQNNNRQSHFEKQIIIETSNVIRSKYLNSIIATYEENLSKNIGEIAPQIQDELVQKFPTETADIEKDIQNGEKLSAIQKLNNLLQTLDYFNTIRIDSELKDNETIALGIGGLISYQIYQNVKETRTIRNIKKIIEDAKTYKKKLDQVKTLFAEYKNIENNTKEEIESIGKISKELGSETKNLFRDIKSDISKNPDRDLQAKDQIKTLYNSLFKNKKENHDSERLGKYKQNVQKIEKNVIALSDSFEAINNNFMTSINTFKKMAQVFDLKIGKDAQKILDKAEKISSVVSLANNVVKSFMTGGPLGAASALTSALGQSPEQAALGQISQKLQEMDRKLDEILSLQKQMIQLQLETMKMVRDLALLVDELHQKEMMKLSELRNDTLVNIEISKSILNKDIRKCESLIEFQLVQQNQANQRTVFLNKIVDADLVQSTHDQFYGSFKSYKKFENIITATHFTNYNDCQRAISDAFGVLSIQENPIYSVFSSNEENNYLKYFKSQYLPLLPLLQNKMQQSSHLAFPLHLPTFYLKDVGTLHYLMNNPQTTIDQKFDQYDIENLISSNALLRYSSSLLVLYPILDFDQQTWKMGIKATIDEFFENLESQSRSTYFLNNALYLTNSAIAQENLLSGALILDDLFSQKNELLSGDTDCSSANSPQLKCAVLSNRILLTNLINYSILNSDKAQYHEAYSSKNLEDIERALANGQNLSKEKVRLNNGKIFFVVEYKLNGLGHEKHIELKSLKEIESTPIFYSESMEKLVKLQAKIIESLISISPQISSPEMNKKQASLLLLKAI